jgi:hypothetical protein
MRVKSWLVLLSAASAAALVIPAAVSTAPVSASARTTDVEVASGTVTGVNGQAMAGATVDLYAWPPDTVLRTLKIGQTVPWKLIATATANSSGTFSLSVTPASLEAEENAAGYTNLEAESGTASWSFPVKAADPAAANVNLAGAEPRTCGGYLYWKNYGHHLADLAEGILRHIGHIAGDTITFSYKRTQSSTFGVSISTDNYWGSYTVDGTNSTVTTHGAKFPVIRKHHTILFQAGFLYGDYRQTCPPGTGGHVVAGPRHARKCPHKDWCICPTVKKGKDVCHFKVMSEAWWGGTSTPTTTTPKYYDSECSTWQKGDTAYTESEANVNFAAGFTIPLVGLGASAQTGYGTDAQMAWYFGSKGRLCATSRENPGQAPLDEQTGDH